MKLLENHINNKNTMKKLIKIKGNYNKRNVLHNALVSGTIKECKLLLSYFDDEKEKETYICEKTEVLYYI